MDKSKIIYIKDEKYFLFDGKTFNKAKDKDAKKYYVTSAVNPSALYFHTHKLPSSLDDKSVEIKMDISIYEEGGASEDKDYITSFIRTPLKTEDNDLVDLFGIETNQSDNLYKDIAQKLGAVDIITPSFLCYHSLYQPGHENTTDIYLYFGDEEAYGTIYANGKYISHRSMENLARVSALCGWELDVLKAALKTRGLQQDAYAEEENANLDTIKASIHRSVEKIIYTLNHKKGIFNMSDTYRVFVDFEGDSIIGLEEIFEYYDLHVKSLQPINTQNNNDRSLNHDFLIANYLLGVVNKKYKSINLSPYEREEPFYKQPAGYLFISAFAGILVVVGAYFALSMMIDANKEEMALLDDKIKSASGLSKKFETKIKDLKAKKENLEKYYATLQKQDNNLQKSKKAVPYINSQAMQRQQMIDDALQGLSKNNLGAVFMEQNNSNLLKIEIVTEMGKEEKIANFLNYMSNRGYQKSYTDKIENNNTIYKSVVEIAR